MQAADDLRCLVNVISVALNIIVQPSQTRYCGCSRFLSPFIGQTKVLCPLPPLLSSCLLAFLYKICSNPQAITSSPSRAQLRSSLFTNPFTLPRSSSTFAPAIKPLPISQAHIAFPLSTSKLLSPIPTAHHGEPQDIQEGVHKVRQWQKRSDIVWLSWREE